MGVILQLLSIGTESTRLVLVQILLQRNGMKLNPITSLYYISPCCFAFLAVPFFVFELPKILNDPSVQINAAVFFSNAAAAFGARSCSPLMSVPGVIPQFYLNTAVLLRTRLHELKDSPSNFIT